MKGQAFVKNGKTLLSGIDPVRRAERLADAVPIKDRTLYYCPSPLFGYGLARLLSRLETGAPNSAVLCVEADSELYELTCENLNIENLTADFVSVHKYGKKLCITNICEKEKLCAFVYEIWGARAFRRVEVVRFTGGWQLFPELYDSLCEALRREIVTDWSNALTLAKLGRLYMHNALRNLPLLEKCPSIGELSFGSKPVLVLGAGPSLDETLDFFAAGNSGCAQFLCCPENRPFKIICVDTCFGALRDRNIAPDLVVILESQHWNLRDFIGCRGWEVPFAVDLSALPSSAKMLTGQGYIFMTPWARLRLLERLKTAGLLPAVIPPLGSVGLTAVELARRFTSGNIICCGLDFSFTADKYHARSTPGHRTMLNKLYRFSGLFNSAAFAHGAFPAISKSGKSVYSNPAMRNYRDLFEREFSADPRLFDITGSGLPLGLKTLSLEDALLLLTEKDLTKTYSEFLTQQRDNILSKFIFEEKERLIALRNILTGVVPFNQLKLNLLLEECDYLWMHFPDSTVGSNFSDISFLNRVRMEIDPALALL